MESAEREDHLPNKDPGEASAQEPQLKDEGVTIGESSGSRSRSVSPETAPPPLPPRLKSNNTHDEAVSLSPGSPRLVRLASKQNLQPKATTSLSLADISTHILPNGSRETHSSTLEKTTALQDVMSKPSFSRMASRRGSEAASIRSYVPNASNAGEVESIFGDFPGMDNERTGWNSAIADNFDSFDLAEFQDEDTDIDFSNEFEPIGELDSDGENEGVSAFNLLSSIMYIPPQKGLTWTEMLLEKWKAKRKHFFILSAAGKPIYTSHGDDHIISSYVGIIQTIISFYQESDDALKSFSAGGTKFVIVSQGALYLVAVSRLLESDSQLRIQLEALYMQILSTLTLPALTHLFSVRPSTDLRRPLQGTESLLSSLADSFTRGSPSTLLSALECLKIRKSHRQTINNTLLKTRVNSLLYGLVVAGGRLVSVVRPKKHSLHPGDLQLIFNMVFEAGGVKAGGGENWIPICLPGFNSSGYLYMYVSFLDIHGDDPGETTEDSASKDDSIAIVLISADKEGFFELQEMRNIVVEVRWISNYLSLNPLFNIRLTP